MKLLCIFLITLFISGCSIFEPKIVKVPIPPPDWPPASEELMKKCEALRELKPVKEGDPVRLGDLLNNMVENYALHYKCSLKNDNWHEWYNKQKKNHEDTVNKAKGSITGSK